MVNEHFHFNERQGLNERLTNTFTLNIGWKFSLTVH